MFELAPLDVGEARLNASRRVRLFAFDQFEQLSLALPDALVQFMQCSSPLRGVALELGRAGRADLLRGPRDFLADTYEARALLLALAFEPLGVDRDSRLRLRDQLLLTLRKLCELVRHAALGPFEVVSPGSQPCFDLLLRRGQGFAELVACRARPLGRSGAPFLGDPAFLFCQQRGGVGPRPDERSFELGAALFGLLGDQRIEPALRARQLLVGAPRRAEEVTQADRGERGGE